MAAATEEETAAASGVDVENETTGATTPDDVLSGCFWYQHTDTRKLSKLVMYQSPASRTLKKLVEILQFTSMPE
jgi:copper(I)-binding protein